MAKRLIELPEASVHEGELEAHVHPAPVLLPLTKLTQTLPSIIDVPRKATGKTQRSQGLFTFGGRDAERAERVYGSRQIAPMQLEPPPTL